MLQEVAKFIEYKKNIKLYWPHLIWIFIVFLMMIQYWWANYSLDWIGISFPGLLGTILYPLLLFLISAVLLPDIRHDNEIDCKNYYFGNIKVASILGSMAIVSTFYLSTTYGNGDILIIGNLLRLLAILLILSLSIMKKEILHKAIPLIVLVLFLIYISTSELHYFSISQASK